MKNRIYIFIKWIVITCFVYIFIFENKYNINSFIMKQFNCKTTEIVAFKLILLVIITLLILVAKQLLENSIILNYSLKDFLHIHPIRSIAISIFVLVIVLILALISLNLTNILMYVISIILILFSGLIGLYIGIMQK